MQNSGEMAYLAVTASEEFTENKSKYEFGRMEPLKTSY